MATYYRWNLRLTGDAFYWDRDLDGNYNQLAQAFTKGQLHLLIEPSPELMALPNPRDPVANEPHRLNDFVLFNGRYYLYHGAGPAIMLFAPWRLITGHDLPERFALFLFCFGGFVFSAGTLLLLLTLTKATPGPFLLALMLLALGICQGVPYLLNRVWMYEIAIGGGYFSISAAIFFLAMAGRALETGRRSLETGGRALARAGLQPRLASMCLAASGLMFGVAVSCRPHLVLTAVIALIGLAIYIGRSRRLVAALFSRELISFAIPLALVGLGIAIYNYQRFGDIFEFGFQYQLNSPGQNRLGFSMRNLVPGLYFMLVHPPDFTPVFPWVQLILWYPFSLLLFDFPPEYFIEPTVGALWAAPFIVGALFAPLLRHPAAARMILLIISASSLAMLAFLVSTHLTTHRYEMDFVPLAVLAAVTGFGIYIARSIGFKRAAIIAAFIITVGFSIVTNMALGLVGPYNGTLESRPAGYVRLASLFSPVERHRPLFNPKIAIEFAAEISDQRDKFREPLVAMGKYHHWALIYFEHTPDAVRLVSRSENSTIIHDLQRTGQPFEFKVIYDPTSRELTTSVNGQNVLVHSMETLVTAPSQVTIGKNRINEEIAVAQFTGCIYNIRKVISEGGL